MHMQQPRHPTIQPQHRPLDRRPRTVVNSAHANPNEEVAGGLDSFASTIKTTPAHLAHGCESDDPKGGVEAESSGVEAAACASLSDASSDTGISVVLIVEAKESRSPATSSLGLA
jgi:hypothetical protein